MLNFTFKIPIGVLRRRSRVPLGWRVLFHNSSNLSTWRFNNLLSHSFNCNSNKSQVSRCEGERVKVTQVKLPFNPLIVKVAHFTSSAKKMSFCSWERDEIYKDHFQPGIYVCAECGYELFSSKQKYDHHSPWPAFTSTIHKDSVAKKPEAGSPRALKVSCGKCGNPLGHEFLKDGPNKSSRF